MRFRIAQIGNHPIICFAVSELSRYLHLMDEDVFVDVQIVPAYDPQRTELLYVGRGRDLETCLPEVADPELDDGIRIEVCRSAGVISGNNDRAVLLAVYRFLRELGCRWVRPGRDGEILPERLPDPVSVSVCETAARRHRGICLEGASSYDHVLNMLDWLPKNGMNTFFVQLFVPYEFFSRWYLHENNPTLPKESITIEDSLQMQDSFSAEMAKRGLLHQAVGHGWTCEPFGIPGMNWHYYDDPLTPEQTSVLALVNGERKLFGRRALNTNVCYSNASVRKTITDSVIAYCKAHPTVTFLHLWLGDNYNNHCECENCRKETPSDHYIILLNEVDAAMTEAGLDTKVVFLLYQEILWTPKTQKLRNPDRFVLMFAPLTRIYTKSFDEIGSTEGMEEVPFVLNRIELPTSVEENVASLRRWQKDFPIPNSFVFDYHLMWNHLFDIGYIRCAEILFRDMKALPQLGLNGMVSCQLQRVGMPTALPLYMMAQALWNPDIDYDAVVDDYFRAAFGADGNRVRAYLSELSANSAWNYLEPSTTLMVVRLEQVAGLEASFVRLGQAAETFSDEIEMHLKRESGNCRKSWEYLRYHSEIVRKMARALQLLAAGDRASAHKAGTDLIGYVQENELRYHNVLDVDYFVGRYSCLFSEK